MSTAAQFAQATLDVISPKFKAASLFGKLLPAGTQPVPSETTSADNTPTVTTSATATITSGRKISPLSDEITLVGLDSPAEAWDSDFSRYGLRSKGGIDAFYTCDTIEYNIFPYTTTTAYYWVWVNGIPVTLAPQSISTTANTNIYIKLTFPTSKRRRVEIFFSHPGAIYEVRIPITGITAPSPKQPVVAFVGDSFWGGSNECNALQSGDFMIARALGVECYSDALGGSGYANEGPSLKKFRHEDRVSRLASANPELIIIQGSVNDDAYSGTLTSEAAATYSDYDTACPGIPIIVFGPQPTGDVGTLHADRSANVAAVKTAASNASNVIAFFDLIGTADGIPPTAQAYTTYDDGDYVSLAGSVWAFKNGGASASSGPASNLPPNGKNRWTLVTAGYFGTGRVGATEGDGTRDILLGSDDVHPSPDGSMVLALWEVERVYKTLKSLAQ